MRRCHSEEPSRQHIPYKRGQSPFILAKSTTIETIRNAKHPNFSN